MKTRYTDKHGRITITGHGPDRVGTHKGRNTLHPTLFRSRLRSKPFTLENVHTAIADTPGASLDTHLIRLLTKHLPTQLLLSAVAGHPACDRAEALSNVLHLSPPEAHHRILHLGRTYHTHHRQPHIYIRHIQTPTVQHGATPYRIQRREHTGT